jgi:hypothetical protein
MSPIQRLASPALAAALAMAIVGCDAVTEPVERVLAVVEVDGPVSTLHPGDQAALTARALDATGRVIEGLQVMWETADPLVAAVSATGVVVALDSGTATIRARIEGKVGSAQVAVVLAPVASISIFPTGVVLQVGATRQLVATPVDAAGRELFGWSITWTSDYPAVAAVNEYGVMTGTGPGYVTITATSEGKSFSIGGTIENGSLGDMPYDLLYHRSTPLALGEIHIPGTTLGIAGRWITRR